MDTEKHSPLVFNLTSACIRRGVITLPGRYRSVLLPCSFTAADAHGNTHPLTLNPSFTLTGLLPFFASQPLKPNDDIVLTPAGANGIYRIHAVIKAKRAPASPPTRTVPQVYTERPSTPVRHHFDALADLVAQYLADTGLSLVPETTQAAPAPACRSASLQAPARAVSEVPRVTKPLEMQDSSLLEPPQVQLEDAPAPSTPTEQPPVHVQVTVHDEPTAEGLLTFNAEPDATPGSLAFSDEEPAEIPTFRWQEELEPTDDFTAPEPQWQSAFTPLATQMVTYLLRPETPVIVRTEQLARVLFATPDAIEEAMGAVNESPALDVYKLHHGVYRVNRLSITAA